MPLARSGGVTCVDLAIALVVLAAIWVALAALFRWVIRRVLPGIKATASWTFGTLASGVLALIFLATIGHPARIEYGVPPVESASPPAEAAPPPAEAAPPPAEAAPPPAKAAPPAASAQESPRYYDIAPKPSPLPTPSPTAADMQSAGSASGSASPAPAYPQFPWPPPPPSAEIVVPNQVLLAGVPHPALSDIAAVLVQALQHAGYYQNVYYEVPDGFALVARLERIYPDGSPYQGVARFDSSFSPLPRFSLSGYLHALFRAPTGYYRVIAFIISDTPFAATGTPVSSKGANMWLEHGANILPQRIADAGYSAGYACTALIYEFQKQDAQSDPVEDTPGVLSADTHLVKAKIAEALKWQLH